MSAADPADLADDSEIDRKQAAANNGECSCVFKLVHTVVQHDSSLGLPKECCCHAHLRANGVSKLANADVAYTHTPVVTTTMSLVCRCC